VNAPVFASTLPPRVAFRASIQKKTMSVKTPVPAVQAEMIHLTTIRFGVPTGLNDRPQANGTFPKESRSNTWRPCTRISADSADRGDTCEWDALEIVEPICHLHTVKLSALGMISA
jgi:hypothetical protein